jgi:hypothetical protein
MKVPMKRLALSLLCAWAVSGAADARAQWWSSWYAPSWTSSWYTPYYSSSYYAPSYYGSYYGGSCCGGSGYGSMYGSSYGSGYGGSSYGGSCCSPCGSSCGYGSCCSPCGSCASYSNFGCNPCSACACSPCVGGGCSVAGCNSSCGTNCAADPASDGKPRPDTRYQEPRDGGYDRGPNKTLDPKTYESSDPKWRPGDPRDDAKPGRLPIDPGERRPDGTGTDTFDQERRKVPETPVPQKDQDSNTRDGLPGPTASRFLLVSTPARPLSLDDKVTWRAAPERTRMKVRSKIAAPVVARSTVDPNSDWSPVPGEDKSGTKLVRK